MKNYLLLSIILVLFSLSCRKVVVSDPIYPDLPAYSESGLNVGGVMINDSAWKFQQPNLMSLFNPMQIVSYLNGDSLVVIMNGNSNYPQSLYFSQIYFVLKNIHIANDSDLVKLNGTTFNIDGQNNYAGLSMSYQNNFVNNGKSSGSISFKKAYLNKHGVIIGDGSPNNPVLLPYVIAGIFNLSLTQDRKYNLNAGRFDRTVYYNSGFASIP